jgi:hypothetical protein
VNWLGPGVTQQVDLESGPPQRPALDATASRTVFARNGIKTELVLFIVFYAPLLLSEALLSGPGWGQALAWLGRICEGLLIWRIVRLAVVATPASLVIRSIWNTHRVGCNEVEEVFKPGPIPLAVYRETALPKSKAGLFVRLREGGIISCTMYSKAF